MRISIAIWSVLQRKHFLHFHNTFYGAGVATTRALEPSFLDELGGQHHDTNIFQAQSVTRKTFFYRSLRVQAPSSVALGSTTVGLPIVTAEGIENRHARNKAKSLILPMKICSGTR